MSALRTAAVFIFCCAAVAAAGVQPGGGGERAAAGAQDVRTLAGALERAEATARDESLPEERRRGAAREAHDLRARLIELAPSSLDAPTWLADQAADSLALAAADDDDLSVLFGVPTSAEKDRVRSAAAEADSLLQRARDTAERLVERLEGDLFEEQVDEVRVRAIENALKRLIDDELEARIPLLAAQAAALLAATTSKESDSQAGASEAARRVIEQLGALRYRTPEAEAERLALTGSALLAASPPDDLQTRSRVREMFRAAAARAPERSRGGRERLRARIQLGLLRTGGPDPAQLAVEQETLLAHGVDLIRAWEDHPVADVVREAVAAEMLAREAEDPAWVGRALSLLVEAVDFAADPAAAREAGAKVAAALSARGGGSAALDLRALPRKAALAAAIALEGDDDVATLNRRVALLRAAAREDAGNGAAEGGGARAEALWRLAAVLAESERTGELIEGAGALAELIRIAPESPRFAAAVEAGPKLAHFALARAAAGADESQLEQARATLARVLFSIVQREEAAQVLPPAERNALRIELARLLLGEIAADEADHGRAGDAAPRTDVLREVLWVLEGLAGAPEPEPRLAASEHAREAEQVALRAVMVAGSLEPEQRAAITARALAWGEAFSPAKNSTVNWLRLEHGRALLAASDPAALAVIRPLAGRLDWADAEAAGVNIAEVRLTLARAQRLAGDDAAAFATLKDLAAALDQPVPAPEPDDLETPERPSEAVAETAQPRPALFWSAWAEMLEILARANESGERTAEMRLHLNRLALIDPAFGGGVPAERIKGVQRKLKPE